MVNGDWLDTQAACPPLNAIEQSRLKELKTKERRARARMPKARAAYMRATDRKIASRCGMTEQAARQVIERQCDGVLLPAVELTFADPAIEV